jgi:hypothetical protein
MEVTSPHGYPLHDHTFHATTTACTGCHPGLTNFDFNGGQTAISNLMGQIEAHFGATGDQLSDTVWNAQLTAREREAVYAYLYVKNDGSRGVHNPNYARTLLQNALHYLQNP